MARGSKLWQIKWVWSQLSLLQDKRNLFRLELFSLCDLCDLFCCCRDLRKILSFIANVGRDKKHLPFVRSTVSKLLLILLLLKD